MDRWQGKVALVTGASAGIGAAIAQKLVENGLQVVGLARRLDKLEALAAKLNNTTTNTKADGGQFHPFKADLTQENDIMAAINYIKRKFGVLHVAVNNAGISKPSDIIDGLTEDFRQILDTNVLAYVIISREAIKLMQENNINDGHIFLINSIAGHYIHPLPKANIYPATKHAVKALAESLRIELVRKQSKIRVTSLSPGLVDTEIFEANGFMVYPEIKSIVNSTPSLKSDDIADALLYVLGTPAHVSINELIIRPTGQIF